MFSLSFEIVISIRSEMVNQLYIYSYLEVNNNFGTQGVNNNISIFDRSISTSSP